MSETYFLVTGTVSELNSFYETKVKVVISACY